MQEQRMKEKAKTHACHGARASGRPLSDNKNYEYGGSKKSISDEDA